MFVHIVGTRPNFMKASPLVKEMKKQGMEQKIIHTGQHYDYEMSTVFFEELDIPKPDYNLDVVTNSYASQTGRIMIECEKIFQSLNPNFVIVYGDVNSTLAASLVASKLNISIIHIESGCRSFDKTMPEEINRILVDNMSDYLFCIDGGSSSNLIKENIEGEIHVSGNLMIDTLKTLTLKDEPNDYVLLTLHRPSNVDDK